MNSRPPRNEQADSVGVQSGWHRWLKRQTNKNFRRHFKRLMKAGKHDDIHPSQTRRYFGYET